jgi:hypothetical protein
MPCIFDGLLEQSEDPRLNVILFPSYKFTQLFIDIIDDINVKRSNVWLFLVAWCSYHI